MRKSKTTGCAPLNAPNIPKLRDKFFYRFVSTPLSFWDNRKWETNVSKGTILTVKIIGIKMVKNRERDVVAVIGTSLTVIKMIQHVRLI